MGVIRRKYWPYKTRAGWIVGVAAIDTDDCLTFLDSEQAAEDWAEKLNARADDQRGAVSNTARLTEWLRFIEASTEDDNIRASVELALKGESVEWGH